MNLIWDRINLRKVIDHRVEPDEVEEAFDDRRRLVRRTRSEGQVRRYQMIAQTASGRYLRVIFEQLPEGIRVTTAFDADDRDYRRYQQRGK